MGSSKPIGIYYYPLREGDGASLPRKKKTRKRGGEKIDCFFEKGWNIMLVWENVKVLGGFYFLCGVSSTSIHGNVWRNRVLGRSGCSHGEATNNEEGL